MLLFLRESMTKCIKMIMCLGLTKKFEIYATNRLTITKPPFHIISDNRKWRKTKAEGDWRRRVINRWSGKGACANPNKCRRIDEKSTSFFQLERRHISPFYAFIRFKYLMNRESNFQLKNDLNIILTYADTAFTLVYLCSWFSSTQ